MRVVWGSGSFSRKTGIGYFLDANAAITQASQDLTPSQAQISILSVIIPTSAIPYPHIPTTTTPQAAGGAEGVRS